MKNILLLLTMVLLVSCQKKEIIEAFDYTSDEIIEGENKVEYRIIIYHEKNFLTFQITKNTKDLQGTITTVFTEEKDFKAKKCDSDNICYYKEYDLSEIVQFRLSSELLYWYSKDGIILLKPRTMKE